ncbi:MAG: helix-turn-helix domain-containing protein [Candidatus Gracilibacteria bacterium]|jgi:transcriptional regulator with XRE-family HTH domain|nr:helix-turn-helix domain-containing protein [Candidatus Gracilibacteria bacterium]
MARKTATSQTIGQKIKKARNKKKLTQEALSRKADVPCTTLVKIESNVVKNPSIETVKKLAIGLETTVDELIS